LTKKRIGERVRVEMEMYGSSRKKKVGKMVIDRVNEAIYMGDITSLI